MIILIRQLILTRLVNIGIAGDRDTVWSAILLQNCYQYLWYTFSKQNQNTSPFRCNESFRDWQVTKFTIHNSHTKSGDWQLPRPIRCIHRSAVEHCRPIQWVFSLASHVFTRPSMHFHRVTLCYHGVCCRRCVPVTSQYWIEMTGWIRWFLAWRLSCTYPTLCYSLRKYGYLQNKSISLWNFVTKSGLRKISPQQVDHVVNKTRQ